MQVEHMRVVRGKRNNREKQKEGDMERKNVKGNNLNVIKKKLESTKNPNPIDKCPTSPANFIQICP